MNTDKLVELQAGRTIGDIPITDPYWEAIHEHRAEYYSTRENMFKDSIPATDFTIDPILQAEADRLLDEI